jgi:phytoene dehydrogenase-like protein
MNADVIVIGGGLSSLACALTLRENGLEPLVLEAADAIGGRVRTERRQGFLLDRGVQVLSTWYPEARRWLDYSRLDLRPCYPGALLRTDGRLYRVTDPWRRLARLPEVLASPVGTLGDKLRFIRLRRRCLRGTLEDLYGRPESTALEYLHRSGFTEQMIGRFFKPFFSGIFCEPDLEVSSRAFEFAFRAFTLGDTALPARGMGEIPAQLASRLPTNQVRTRCRVERLSTGAVQLTSGERLRARALVIATDGTEARRLLGASAIAASAPPRGTTCLYFAASRAPFRGPYLVLNGEGQGQINSVFCPTNLSDHYAPAGQALVAVTCHGAHHNPDTLETVLRHELSTWFGNRVHAWERLAVYRIPAALPAQSPPVPYPGSGAQRISDGLWVCGEYGSAPSIHWALHSGRRAGAGVAHAILGRVAEQSTAGLRLPTD